MELNWMNEQGPYPKHPIQLLPVEVWGNILNQLETEDISNVRLVCKQFVQDVMDYYNYDIDLNEDSPGFDYIQQLRIVSLNIKRLVKEPFANLPAYDGPGLTFKYPNKIRRIKIDHSPISIWNIHNLMMLCHKNLTHIYILRYEGSIVTNEFPTQTRPYQFPNLRTCHLKLDLGLEEESTSDRFLWSTFVSSELPKLQNLHVELDGGADGNGILKDLVKLMTKNPTGLQTLDIRDRVNRLGDRQEPLSSSELSALNQIKNLRALELFGRDELHFLYGGIIKYILGKQQNLETLKLRTMPISGDLLKITILNNFKTLKIVQATCLSLSEERPFDLSVFKNCSQLIELELEIDWKCYTRAEISNRPELVSLNELPQGILKLRLSNFHILSRDIIGLLNSDALKTLENLRLWSVGRSGDFGVNSEVLETIGNLEVSSLSRVEVDANRSSDCLEEAAKYEEIKQRLGFSYDDEYFVFKDVGVDNRLIPRPDNYENNYGHDVDSCDDCACYMYAHNFICNR